MHFGAGTLISGKVSLLWSFFASGAKVAFLKRQSYCGKIWMKSARSQKLLVFFEREEALWKVKWLDAAHRKM